MPEGAAVPAERALTAPLLPPAAWPAGLAMPQPPPAAPRCRRLRDAQQRARTAAALTAAPDADRSRPLLEPSRAEPSPSGAAHSGSGRRAPRPAPPGWPTDGGPERSASPRMPTSSLPRPAPHPGVTAGGARPPLGPRPAAVRSRCARSRALCPSLSLEGTAGLRKPGCLNGAMSQIE